MLDFFLNSFYKLTSNFFPKLFITKFSTPTARFFTSPSSTRQHTLHQPLPYFSQCSYHLFLIIYFHKVMLTPSKQSLSNRNNSFFLFLSTIPTWSTYPPISTIFTVGDDSLHSCCAVSTAKQQNISCVCLLHELLIWGVVLIVGDVVVEFTLAVSGCGLEEAEPAFCWVLLADFHVYFLLILDDDIQVLLIKQIKLNLWRHIQIHVEDKFFLRGDEEVPTLKGHGGGLFTLG